MQVRKITTVQNVSLCTKRKNKVPFSTNDLFWPESEGTFPGRGSVGGGLWEHKGLGYKNVREKKRRCPRAH